MKIFTKIENEWTEIHYKGDLWNKWNIKSFDKFIEFLKLQAGGFFFSILWGRWCSDRVKEDLAKFAYMLKRKVKKFSIPPKVNVYGPINPLDSPKWTSSKIASVTHTVKVL
jgi:hypothetical protein